MLCEWARTRRGGLREEGEVVVAFNADGEGEHSTLPLYLGLCRFAIEGNAQYTGISQIKGIQPWQYFAKSMASTENLIQFYH